MKAGAVVSRMFHPGEFHRVVHLKQFGYVKVFRKTFKNEATKYYIMYLPTLDATEQVTRAEFKEFHSIHWGIECYHRALGASVWY